MSKADATHFGDYRRQTEIKHRILKGYLPAYFRALSGTYSSLGYVDGFAGRGSYVSAESGEARDGSPLLALKLIAADEKLAQRVQTFFVESRADHFADLERAVIEFHRANPRIRQPRLRQGKFADHIGERLAEIEASGHSLAPTFLFVDPCGVDGTSFNTIARILQTPGSELFLFFNSSGLERVIGAARSKGESATLSDLYGSEVRVRRLLGSLPSVASARQVEESALSEYFAALRSEGKAGYILPFRIEAEGRQDTSHYLIHASKRPLGFKIMKHVMLEMLQNEGDTAGILELRQASAGGVDIRFDLAQLRLEVLAALEADPKQASVFLDEWVNRPTDFYSDGQYKRLLLELEDQRRVEVFKDQECSEPYPASLRTKRRPKSDERMVTLGPNCWLRRKS